MSGLVKSIKTPRQVEFFDIDRCCIKSALDAEEMVSKLLLREDPVDNLRYLTI